MYRAGGLSFPVAEDLGARGINLPSGARLERAQVREIADGVRSFFGSA